MATNNTKEQILEDNQGDVYSYGKTKKSNIARKTICSPLSGMHVQRRVWF